jgi:hypothetical protein
LASTTNSKDPQYPVDESPCTCRRTENDGDEKADHGGEKQAFNPHARGRLG